MRNETPEIYSCYIHVRKQTKNQFCGDKKVFIALLISSTNIFEEFAIPLSPHELGVLIIFFSGNIAFQRILTTASTPYINVHSCNSICDRKQFVLNISCFYFFKSIRFLVIWQNHLWKLFEVNNFNICRFFLLYFVIVEDLFLGPQSPKSFLNLDF